MKGKFNFRSLIIEISKVVLLVFILSNIMSYLRQPKLDSTQLPNIEAQLLDGTVFQLEEDKPLLIHFWATWCHTCKLEAPNIESVSKEYRVLTIAVNSGSDAKVKAYMQEHDLHFKVVNDLEGTWVKAFKVEAYPTTFIYDSKGELNFTEVGYTTTVGLLARMKMLK